MASVVGYQRSGNVGVITIDSPPVNALGQAVRSGLIDALDQGLADTGAGALVLMGAGRTFTGGADIREFGKPPSPPALHDVIARYEASPKPVVAAIHGTALGGGLELALGCHYRVARGSAPLGLPEVKLGLIPGAGGTQRLPRLAGIETALEMIVSGDPMPAAKAKGLGVVDAIIDGDLATGAVALRGIARRRARTRRCATATRSWRRHAPGLAPWMPCARTSRGARAATWRRSARRCDRDDLDDAVRRGAGRASGRSSWSWSRRRRARRCDPRLLRRARGRQDPRRADDTPVRPIASAARHRRRHDGRRHRDGLRQRRHAGPAARDDAGGARRAASTSIRKNYAATVAKGRLQRSGDGRAAWR